GRTAKGPHMASRQLLVGPNQVPAALQHLEATLPFRLVGPMRARVVSRSGLDGQLPTRPHRWSVVERRLVVSAVLTLVGEPVTAVGQAAAMVQVAAMAQAVVGE